MQRTTELIEILAKLACYLFYSTVEYCSKRTQHWDFNKFSNKQRRMIQNAQACSNCENKSKLQKTNLKISLDQIAVLFKGFSTKTVTFSDSESCKWSSTLTQKSNRKWHETISKQTQNFQISDSESRGRLPKKNHKETKNCRLQFFAVDPCKRIDTNEHKETYLQLNCCGSLEVINTNTKGILYKICNCGIQRRTQTQKNCGLRKAIDTKHKLSWITEGGQHDTKQSGLGFESTQKWNFFERNSTQNGCTQRKWLRIWLQINTIWIEWTRKKWSSCEKFQC